MDVAFVLRDSTRFARLCLGTKGRPLARSAFSPATTDARNTVGADSERIRPNCSDRRTRCAAVRPWRRSDQVTAGGSGNLSTKCNNFVGLWSRWFVRQVTGAQFGNDFIGGPACLFQFSGRK